MTSTAGHTHRGSRAAAPAADPATAGSAPAADPATAGSVPAADPGSGASGPVSTAESPIDTPLRGTGAVVRARILPSGCRIMPDVGSGPPTLRGGTAGSVPT